MRLSFWIGMAALALCLRFAPTLLDGIFWWCWFLFIAGAIWILSPPPEQKGPNQQ